MKKLKLFAMGLFILLGSLTPQSSFAYKYYVILPDGSTEMFEAANKHAAILYFNTYYKEGVLQSRPDGGTMMVKFKSDTGADQPATREN